MSKETIVVEKFGMMGQIIDRLNNEGELRVDFSRLSEDEKNSCMNFIDGDIYAFDGTKEEVEENIYEYSVKGVPFLKYRSNRRREYNCIISTEKKTDIADSILDGFNVVFDVSHLTSDEAKEVFDFICGVAYGACGNIQKLEPNVYKIIVSQRKTKIYRSMLMVRMRTPWYKNIKDLVYDVGNEGDLLTIYHVEVEDESFIMPDEFIDQIYSDKKVKFVSNQYGITEEKIYEVLSEEEYLTEKDEHNDCLIINSERIAKFPKPGNSPHDIEGIKELFIMRKDNDSIIVVDADGRTIEFIDELLARCDIREMDNA